MISEKQLSDPLYWTRWSINSGLFTEKTNNLLYGYAYLAHSEVQSAEVSVDLKGKRISYKLMISKKLTKAIVKYNRLRQATGIIELWFLRRLVRKFGNLDLEAILSDFVSNLCGPDWSTNVSIEMESLDDVARRSVQARKDSGSD